jgi:very-short-patch-repair endonuclease
MAIGVIDEALRQARRDLLDIGKRNRLVSTPRGRVRSTSIEILDELTEQVYSRLVVDGKAMSFLGIATDDDENDLLELDQPDDEVLGDAASRHSDDKLQTRLASKTLQSRLLKQYYDARTFAEEQGVSIHFLAMGFLKWFESDTSTVERFAPLVLVPVQLERQSAGSKFKLAALEEELATNLSLQAMLEQEFHIRLPGVSDQDVVEPEEFDPAAYYAQVRAAIASQKRWEVLENDMVLWFFSFSKFLMYRDLDPKTWPEHRKLSEHANVESVFGDGFRNEPPILNDGEKLDPVLDPAELSHVVDADGSQSIVIEEVRRGSHLVVQGPPGTGKSQTITNMIAAAVKAGKKVLFVAEKMAALNVVKARLDNIGLGAMCLELHSHKANKKSVLADIGETLQTKRPRLSNLKEQVDQLRSLRDQLNDYVEALHYPLVPAQLTAYQGMGELVRLQAKALPVRRVSLEQPLTWTKEQFSAKRALVHDISVHLERVGAPQSHPWRGVELPSILPSDLQQICEQASTVIERLDRLALAAGGLAALLQQPAPRNGRELSALAVLANQLVKAPALDPSAIAHAHWATHVTQIDSLLEHGKQLQTVSTELAGIVEPSAWQTDVSQARKQIVLRGNSWFRWLNRGYRSAMSLLADICVNQSPATTDGQQTLLDALIAGQLAQKAVLAGDELGRHCFGSLWQGETSEWNQLRAVAEWVKEATKSGASANFREVLARLSNKKQCARLLQDIASDFKKCFGEAEALVQTLQLDLREAFAVKDVSAVPLAELRDRCARWQLHPGEAHVWVAYRQRWKKLVANDLRDFAQTLHAGQIEPALAVDHFSRAYFESIVRECHRQFPELADFTRDSHEAARDQFRTLDRLRIELARKEVALSHYQAIPKEEAIGEMAKVRNELQKRRRHWPIRRLLQEAGHALQAIKPVFMMSPTSIAQFLQPGVLDFDLLLIDEASQVRPVEALGAMARCKQVVVVGDDKQMPPTSFFSTSVDGGDEDSDETPSNLESILGLCVARNIRSRMLSWHYRSRHQSLIAVSNCEFYGNKLYVIPNPEPKMDGLGLHLKYLTEGRFDRGGTATNIVEAKAIAAAVMTHARRSPEKSLGVGAFSVAQRDTILAELELLRRHEPSLEPFFASSGEEPFFVKNLENLQGDERDVIFISVGYGPDKDGYVSMGFGPLSLEGGERRLNVLISRARDRCEVFSSMRADDIDLARAKSRGAAVLKRFLKYAETGWLDAETKTEGEHDSVFEEEVAKAIRDHGYEVDAQVGVAGFFLDLAVKDPSKPGRYLLGIECDGATYHSSRWARDRDRLRQDVLESRGWTIHRIWSTDWFRRPNDELRRLLGVLDLAKAPQTPGAPKDVELPDVIPEDEKVADEEVVTAQVIDVVPYQEATTPGVRINTSKALYEVPVSSLAEVAYNIVLVEGPIHRDEIARRFVEFWGGARTTKKVVAAVGNALDHAESNRRIVSDRDFYTVPASSVMVRNREAVSSSTLRQPEMLPPQEISEALLQIVTRHLGVTDEEAIVATGRLLGFRATSQQLKRVISRELDGLVGANRVSQRGSKLFAADPAATGS